MDPEMFDFVIIGSGFGGSVSALRLAEKGYSVLVLEKGKRYQDQDFARTNLQFWKYLWAPAIRSFGILQISILRGVMVLHGSGVGGGSLGYANVLEVPNADTFDTSAWNDPIPWGTVLKPYYQVAQRMLGVSRNPGLWHADMTLQKMAEEIGMGHTFRTTDVGAFFGEPDKTVPDPYFDGQGPERSGCTFCGGCMVGCRHNSKNTLPKNYLYFAERHGVEIRAETLVTDVRPEESGSAKGRYQISYRSSTSLFPTIRSKTVFAHNVILSAGVIGNLKLLLTMRDVRKTLPRLSPRLGERVRTNSEALLGSVARGSETNFSQGVAISSIFNADSETRIEPVRYPEGSSLMRILAAPLIDLDDSIPLRLIKSIWWMVSHPKDFLRAQVLPGWAHKVTILLVMQNKDNRMRLRLGRSPWAFFRRVLVSEEEPGFSINAQVTGTHQLTREFSRRTNGVPMGSLGENLLNLPTTAHILGGAPVGRSAEEGVVDQNFQVHNYPGLYIIDATIMPANPGVNPSLTITALAEYAIDQIGPKDM